MAIPKSNAPAAVKTPAPAPAQPAAAQAPVTSTATAPVADVELSEEEKAAVIAEFKRMKEQRKKQLARSREYMTRPETVEKRKSYAEKQKAKRARLKAMFEKLGLDLTADDDDSE